MCQATKFLISVTLVAFLFKYTHFVRGSVYTITKSVFSKNERYIKHIHVKGNGIDDFLVVSVPEGTTMRNLFIPNGLLIGDYRYHETTAFTEREDVLLVIHGKSKKCTQRFYLHGKVVTRTFSDSECNAAKKKIVNWWNQNNEKKELTNIVFDPYFKELAVVKTERGHSTVCQSDILVYAYGFQGRTSLPCETARRIDLQQTNKGFVLGDYRTDSLSLVSAARKLYTVSGGETITCTRHTDRTRGEPLDAEACDIIRNIAENRLTALAIKPEKEFKIERKSYMNFEVCFVNIHVRGNGIDETVSTTCADSALMQTVFIKNGFIMGDYVKNDKCLFTETTGSLTVITKGKCYRRSRVGGRRHLLILSSTSCAQTKQKIRNVLGNAQFTSKPVYTIYRHRHYEDKRCTEEAIMQSRGINELLTIDCNVDVDEETIFTQRGFALGDYRLHAVSAFTDTPDSLVVIQGKEKTCTKRIFSGGKYETLKLDPWSCQSVKASVEKAITNSKTKSGMKQDNKNVEFHFVRRKHEILNECKDDLTIHGNGITDTIHVSCSLGERLALLYIPNGFVYGDYRSGLTAYADSPGSMVIIKGTNKRCSRYLYQDQKTQVPIGEAECKAAKQFVDDKWDNKRERGLRSWSRQQLV